MWNTREIETALEARLIKSLGEAGKSRYAAYVQARDKVIDHVANEFKAAEPELSDHSPRHIADVLDRAYDILREPAGKKRLACLSPMEHYLLCMMIVFHDVGNMFGRKDHHLRVAEVYDWARGTDSSVKRERSLVLAGTRAHTGKSSTGSPDTLADVLGDEDLDGQPIRLRDLAATLRFADELAEGPHRTSEFKLTKNMYSSGNSIYHVYASITHPYVDRGTERVRLTYEITVTGVGQSKRRQNQLAELLSFTYGRAVKLDQERRYVRYYSKLLPFRETSVVFNFHTGNGTLNLDLAPLVFDDKVIPGEDSQSIPKMDASYSVGRLVRSIVSRMG